SCLIFACTLTEHIPNLLEAIDHIQNEHPDLKIGAGGYAVSLERGRFNGLFLGDTPEEWRKWLSTI
ncbi:MAG: MerR family transcriptional regulator, partial [Exiguobacterium sp.]|nr:MerR family transcriptional regulator [Exiguobacterium sp.]